MYVMPSGPTCSLKLEAALIQQPAQRMTATIRLALVPNGLSASGSRDARFIDLMSDAAYAQQRRESQGSTSAPKLAEMEPDERLERLQQELNGQAGTDSGCSLRRSLMCRSRSTASVSIR